MTSQYFNWNHSPDLPGGAAGTVYTEETNRGPQYSQHKYNKDLNRTMVVGNHRRIVIDNTDIDEVSLVDCKLQPTLYYM